MQMVPLGGHTISVGRGPRQWQHSSRLSCGRLVGTVASSLTACKIQPPPPLILSATSNGEHHMVKQQASHDNKGRYLTGTLEPSYRSANLLRQITTMVESMEQQKLDGLGTSWAYWGRRVELRSWLGPLTLKHLIGDLHSSKSPWSL